MIDRFNIRAYILTLLPILDQIPQKLHEKNYNKVEHVQSIKCDPSFPKSNDNKIKISSCAKVVPKLPSSCSQIALNVSPSCPKVAPKFGKANT